MDESKAGQNPSNIMQEPEEPVAASDAVSVANEGSDRRSPEARDYDSLKNVTPIGRLYGVEIAGSEAIKELVEKPLVEACKIFYDKNIQTTGSNANLESVYPAYIDISWDSLSRENRQIAEQMGLHPIPSDWGYHGEIIEITMPISEKTSVGDVSNHFKSLANQFVLQDPSWMTVYTIEQLKEIYMIPEDKEVTPEEFEGYYYDPASGKFYLSEEHFQKVKAYEDLQNQSGATTRDPDAHSL